MGIHEAPAAPAILRFCLAAGEREAPPAQIMAMQLSLPGVEGEG